MVFFTARYRTAGSTAVSAAALAALVCGQVAFAQTAVDASSDKSQTNDKLTEIVVTGSRIHRDASDTTTDAPLTVVGSETLADRGYIQVGDALNQVTSNTPQLAITPHD